MKINLRKSFFDIKNLKNKKKFRNPPPMDVSVKKMVIAGTGRGSRGG
jgi:hypothetical protein